jgi:hypothetical protein
VRPYRYEWSREQLMRLRAAGMGTVRIAKIYGCDQSTVRNALKRLGIPTYAPAVRITDLNLDRMIDQFMTKVERARRIAAE